MADVWETKVHPQFQEGGNSELIYKGKGDSADPNNYIPITLLSQVREIIDASLDSALIHRYTPHSSQVGFTEAKGTEHAILRALDGYNRDEQ